MKKKIIVAVVCICALISICALCTGFARKIPENYINMESEEFHENFIDMREVVDFSATEKGLAIYLENGEWYYWER